MIDIKAVSCYFRVNTKEESRLIQLELFRRGFTWGFLEEDIPQYLDKPLLFTDHTDGQMLYGSYTEDIDNNEKEMTYFELMKGYIRYTIEGEVYDKSEI